MRVSAHAMKTFPTATAVIIIFFGQTALWSQLYQYARYEATVFHLHRDASLLFPEHYINRSVFNISPVFEGSTAERDHLNASDVTIATQFHINPTNLQRFLDVLTRWDGPISVAAYVDQEHLDYGMKRLTQFFATHRHFLQTKTVGFYLVTDKRLKPDGSELLYPINMLRNIAIEHVKTDYMLSLDIDFIPSLESHALIQKHLQRNKYLRNKTALIMPAFQRRLSKGEHDYSLNVSHIPPTKEKLVRAMQQQPGIYRPFNGKSKPAGHGPTDFKMWVNSTAAYHVEYRLDFEPYFVLHVQDPLPPFWEHFAGYGRNKLSWVEELARAGYQFDVAHDVFLIHINHSSLGSRRSKRVLQKNKEEYRRHFKPYLKTQYPSHYVEVLWPKDGKWHTANIVRVNNDGTYDVQFDADGTFQPNTTKSHIRPFGGRDT